MIDNNLAYIPLHVRSCYSINDGLQNVGPIVKKAAKLGIDLTYQFLDSLGLPHRLGDVGIGDEKLDIMAKEAVRTSGLSTRSYVKLNEIDVLAIYRKCL